MPGLIFCHTGIHSGGPFDPVLQGTQKTIHGLFAQVYGFGTTACDECYIGDADNFENKPKVQGGDVAVLDGRSFSVNSTGSNQNRRLPAFRHSRAIEPKCQPLANDVVEPCLQDGGNIIVVDRSGDDDMVRRNQLLNQARRTGLKPVSSQVSAGRSA